MRILVTGGAGFIGHHLVRRLTRDQAGSVIVLDNLFRGTFDNLSGCERNVSFRRQDVRNRAAVDEAIRGCGVVFHLAAQSNVMGAAQDTEYSFSTNVLGTFNVLQAAHAARVKRVVFTSSREVYGDPQKIPVSETAPIQPKNAYGASKAAGEMYCRVLGQSGLQVVILRLANAYGLRDENRVIPLFVENAIRGLPLVLYGGRQVLDFVWVDTVVDVLMKAGFCEYFPEPVNIGSGKGTKIADLANRVLQVTGSVSPVQVKDRRDIEVSHFVADIKQAQQRFGTVPPEDCLFGLDEVVHWMKGRILSNRP